MKRNDMVFHTRGGRIPLGALRRVAELAMVHGDGRIRLSSRQEIMLTAIRAGSRDRVRFELNGVLAEHQPQRPNIVSTRPVAGRGHRTPWLSEGAYDTILSQFVSPPAIPIGISDPQQAYLPLYTGQVNFLATTEPGFWRVHFNTRNLLRPTVLAGAVHSDGVPGAAFVIQQAILRDGGADLPELQRTLDDCLAGLTREIPPGPVHCLEDARPIDGFVLDSRSDTYTLGIPLLLKSLAGEFLVELCLAANRHAIAMVGVTPWQSLLVHGIPRGARDEFERLLLRHRVCAIATGWDSVFYFDTRSEAVERVADDLLRALNEGYPHPGALRIALSDHPLCIPDTPIIVRAECVPARWPFGPQWVYSVYIRENFDRLNPMLIPCANRIPADRLNDAVLSAIARCAGGERTETSFSPAPVQGTVVLYQCAECATEYSEQYGDPLGGIDAGTPFAELPLSWCCPTCGAPHSRYMTTRGYAA